MDIINKLTELNIETNRTKISTFDMINIIDDLIDNDSKIKNILTNYNDNSFEYNHLKKIILHDRYIDCVNLLNNHYTNGFLDIFFIINNVQLFGSDIFNVIYNRRHEINKITSHIKKCWEKILNSDLIKFYNSILINKWIETLEFKLIDKYDYLKHDKSSEIEYNKYLEIFKIFDKNVCILRDFVYKISDKIKNINHPGCYNLHESYYFFYISLFTGLDINRDKLKILFKYALKELSRLTEEYKNLIKKIKPEISHLDIRDINNIIKNDNTFKFKSKDDFKKIHKKLIDELHKYYIEINNIKEYKPVNLSFIDDPNLATAYWAYDTFYLNVANWDKINTYESLALTLHEAIPGHHTQLNYSINSKNKPIHILYHLFGITNGFCEGWALFMESNYPYYTNTDHIGRLQYEILRTLRIVVDIGLNFVGLTIEDCKEFMKKYVTFDDKIIESELFRYITIPGQALCYKIGCEIFRKIQKKYNKDDYMELYKKIIYGKEKSLECLLRENNLSFEDVFT